MADREALYASAALIAFYSQSYGPVKVDILFLPRPDHRLGYERTNANRRTDPVTNQDLIADRTASNSRQFVSLEL